MPVEIDRAVIDPSGRYRYFLSRNWASHHGRICFIMLNPSTADADKNDPTIRSCIRIAQRLGLGSLHVVNLFAFRATDQRYLKFARDPIGPDNDAEILHAVRDCDYVVAAWGVEKSHYIRRVMTVKGILADAGIRLYCLGRNKDGSPVHPLYLARDTPLRLLLRNESGVVARLEPESDSDAQK